MIWQPLRLTTTCPLADGYLCRYFQFPCTVYFYYRPFSSNVCATTYEHSLPRPCTSLPDYYITDADMPRRSSKY